MNRVCSLRSDLVTDRGPLRFRLSHAKHWWLVLVWSGVRLFAFLVHVILRILSKVSLISLPNSGLSRRRPLTANDCEKMCDAAVSSSQVKGAAPCVKLSMVQALCCSELASRCRTTGNRPALYWLAGVIFYPLFVCSVCGAAIWVSSLILIVAQCLTDGDVATCRQSD